MDLTVEIFAIGQWNGMTFDKEDLNMMAAAFNSLKEVHKVPLKFGHNDEQPFTDGQPALGWVSEVWVDGTKLMAKFVDIPEVVYTAMQNKLYKHVSVELDMGVEHKGSYYTWVLSGVALLGADIPAVNTLADLTSYMGKNNELSFKKRVAFTAININKQTEEFDMNELEKAQAEIAALKAENEAKDEKIVNFTKDKVELESKVTEFKAKEEADAKEAEKAYFAKAKSDMVETLEVLVKSGTITPAQREKFTADFKEDKSVIERLNFTLDVLKAGEEGSKGFDKTEHGKGNEVENEEDEGKTPDEILMSRISAMQEKEPSLSFSVARNKVMKADPKLATAYVNMNGES